MDQKRELILWIFESIYAPSTILISGYISVYMRVIYYYLSVINNYLSLIINYLSVIINYLSVIIENSTGKIKTNPIGNGSESYRK